MSYKQEDIELTQDAARKMIEFYSQESNVDLLVNQIREENFLGNFNSIVTFFLKHFLSVMEVDKNISLVVPLNKIIRKEGRDMGENTVLSGVKVAYVTYLAICLVNKGLKKHNWQILVELDRILPFTELENAELNAKLLGVEFASTKLLINSKNISVLKNTSPFIGKGRCPFTSNSHGIQLNKNLSSTMRIFFNNFLEKLNLESQYKECFEDKTPDFVNVLLGRFEINEDHLKKYPQYFQEL